MATVLHQRLSQCCESKSMIYVTQEMRLTNKRTLSLTGYWFSFNRKKANRNLQQQANSLQLEKTCRWSKLSRCGHVSSSLLSPPSAESPAAEWRLRSLCLRMKGKSIKVSSFFCFLYSLFIRKDSRDCVYYAV